MKTIGRFLAGLGAMSLGSLAMATGPAGQTATAAPTYTKDVAPILYKNCTSCHRPGRNRADVAADLRGRPAVCESHPRRSQRRDTCRRGTRRRRTGRS